MSQTPDLGTLFFLQREKERDKKTGEEEEDSKERGGSVRPDKRPKPTSVNRRKIHCAHWKAKLFSSSLRVGV